MKTGEIEQLIHLMSKLPALGPRSARRAVLHLLSKKETFFIPLIQSMQSVLDHVRSCPECGNMDTSSPCSICSDPNRNKGQICVVRDVTDLWALERAGVFRGVYHVLGGLLSALDGIGPDELNIQSLMNKISEYHATEVILALPATVEGQSTVHYLTEKLESFPIHISTLSRGVPIGGELDYLDDGTLQTAFNTRRDV